jgi:hypothetical protein
LVTLLFSCMAGNGLSQVDFDLSGANPAFMYGQYGQLGHNGFFGAYDVDRSASGDFAPLNGWLGNRNDVNLFAAGSNAAFSSIQMETRARLGGDWVMAEGKYYINAYTSGTSQGAYVAMSPGQLATWSVQAKTPAGRILYGKQKFSPGLMLQFGNTRTQEFLIVEKGAYCPNILQKLVGGGWLPASVMRFFPGGSYWALHTKAESEDQKTDLEKELEADEKKESSTSSTGKAAAGSNSTGSAAAASTTTGAASSGSKPEPTAIGSATVSTSTTVEEPADSESSLGQTRITRIDDYGPGYISIGFGTMPWAQIRPGGTVSWNLNDINAATYQNFVVYLRYICNNLELGAGTFHIRSHQGPELQSTAFRRQNTPTKETYTTEGWLYARFNNGRVMLDAELDWFNRTWRYQRSLSGFFQDPDNTNIVAPLLPEFYTDGSGRSRFAPRYWESWRFTVQGGVVLGPSSIRVLFAYLPGQDRRHGIFIDRQPFIQEELQEAHGFFDPYSILLSYLYGSGVNAGAYINAASVYAVKLDHLIASNLLFECSLLHARRTSNGYGIGYIRPNPDVNRFGTMDYRERDDFLNPAPSIPERSLGWELMAGIVWKLLESDTENWTVETRAACWWPGPWFNHACVDKSVVNWTVPDSTNNWGVNSDRRIDPVLAFEVRFGTQY